MHWHSVSHTVIDNPHNILTPRHPNIWWMGHHQVKRLAQQYWNSSRYLEWELCMPSWGQITCLTHTLVWQALHAGKYSDDSRDILHLKLCNVNIHTYLSISWKSNRGTVRHWQPMCIILKQKLRGVTSTVTLLQYAFLSRVSGMHTISQQRCMKRTPRPYQRLSNWLRSSTGNNRLQLPCHLLQWRWHWTMTDVLFVARQVVLVIAVLMHSVITATALVILSKTAQRKFPHQEHLITMTDHAPTHIIITTTGTDHHLSTTAPGTTRGRPHTPYPTTAAHNTHPPTGVLGNILTRTTHTVAATTHTWWLHSSCWSYSHN